MKLRMIQKGFNFSQDGPGNRLVYHLQGCNFHCPWCSNPESIPVAGCRIKTSKNPEGRLSFTEVDTEAVAEEIISARPMFFEGGGVTFTGGEPTLQWEALEEILSAVKSAGIHTAIETNGSSPFLQRLLPLLDYVMIDFKHYDVEKYRLIGGDSAQVMRNLQLLAADKKACVVRTPLISGFNAGADDIQGFVRCLATISCETMAFELLPYHEYGKDKWEQCGREYTVTNGTVSRERVEEFRSAYCDAGLHLITT